MGGNRLSPGILDHLEEIIPSLTRGTIQKNISLVRQSRPSVTLNGAAQIVARQYGRSILPRLSDEDRQSIAHIQVSPIVKGAENTKRSKRNIVRLAGGKTISIDQKKHPLLVQIIEGFLLASPFTVLAAILLFLSGEGNVVQTWIIETLSKPFERMIFSVYLVSGLFYIYYWIGLFQANRKKDIPKKKK